MFEQTDPEWQKLVAEIISGMKEWADQHPTASLAEIERETMRRMAQLQARLMEDILRARATEQRAAGSASLVCPECGAKMAYRGERAAPTSPRRARCGAQTRLCGLSRMRSGLFSPWMNN